MRTSKLEKYIKAFIFTVFMLIILWFGFIMYVGTKTIGTINDQGLKGVAETIWCGKQENCSLDIQKVVDKGL